MLPPELVLLPNSVNDSEGMVPMVLNDASDGPEFSSQ